MSEMALGASPEAGGRREEEKPPRRVAPTCITGRVYHIVQMAGLNGEKAMKLRPVSNPLGNVLPLVQSQSTADNVKENTSRSGHDSLKSLFANTTFPFVTNPEHKAAAPGQGILQKPFGQEEKAHTASVVKENPPTRITPTILSNDGFSFQKDVASECLGKNTNNVVLNTQNDPVTVRSPVLPSGHHLQIPAHAKVNSVSASLLPPGIQQKILAAAASGPGEVTKAPTVIFVSPVNIVKRTASKPLQNIYSKPITEATEPQRAVNNSTLNVTTSDSEKQQMFPVKWTVQENSQSAPCLVPVKSSNSMVSKILNFLSNMKNVNNNMASVLPPCSNSLSESQGKITNIKDNALVVCNGKVYLLTKKECNIASTNNDDKEVPSNGETHIRKQKSKILSSPADSTTGHQVINQVLSNKEIACNVMGPNVSGNMKPQLQSEVSKRLESASSSLVSPLGSLQTSSINKLKVVSTLGHVSVSLKDEKKSPRREKTNQNIVENILSSEEPTALFPYIIQDTFGEEKEKEKIETALGMNIQNKHIKEEHKTSYPELRKRFGLFKEERVCLRRTSVSFSLPRSEETASSSSVQVNDTGGLWMTVPIKCGFNKEKVIKEQQEEQNIKREREISPVLEHAKKNIKRKTEISPVLEHAKKMMTLNPDLESCTEMGNQSSYCKQAGSEENPTCFLQSSPSLDSGSNPCVPNIDKNMLNPVSHCCDNEPSLSSFTEDIFSFNTPDLEETIRDEKITKLKLLLREREVALEKFRKKTQST
ncbi:hypothetical protein JRQ81_014018 [Phrynocephalus forsythii]|uniref:Ligand dependent nuclear receptor interacting factor 1 n=1 Tax=Phrynocephalus forsythii TaxID=171643 RepID=A0A9Q0XYI4_9SAUR|nr:hypothetical protein JRQ81_014018 [Phrynocephalus forsythii]